MRLSRALVAVTVSVMPFLLTGCHTGPTPPPNWDQPTIEGIQGEWVIERVDGKLVSDVIPEGPLPLTLSINDDGTINGFSGVNRFNGSIDVATLSEDRWVSSSFTTTKMAGPRELVDFEQVVLSSLHGSYRLVYFENDVLMLKDSGVFKNIPASTRVDSISSWHCQTHFGAVYSC